MTTLSVGTGVARRPASPWLWVWIAAAVVTILLSLSGIAWLDDYPKGIELPLAKWVSAFVRWLIAGVFDVTRAISALLELVRGRILVRLGARLDKHVTHDLFAALIEDRIATRRSSGSQSIRDLETVRSFLTGPGLLAFFDAPWVPLFLGIISSALPVINVSPFWQMAISGSAILLAVVLNARGERGRGRLILRRASA